MKRPYDVVLYGATGFVGRQTVAYFAEHGAKVSWALAGRSAGRLESVRKRAGAGAAGAGILVADAADANALDALAAQARVVLSTAGPFALYGSELVAACVRQGTHYVDITGETPWIRGLIDQHHTKAARDGTRIIPCCGFDSVPSDLGAWMITQAIRQRHGEACAEVKACFSMRGGLNGGTLASLLNIIDTGQNTMLADPFLLNPADAKPNASAARAQADPVAPHHDADFDAWVGPFMMGPINTRVVRRSAALLADADESGYARDFSYQEYMRFGKGPVAAFAAAGMSLGMGVGQAAMLFAPNRRIAKALAPGPGEGPSQQSMDGGSFRCELVGKSARGKIVRGRIAGQGDPGNRATTKFVCESALALLLAPDELPGGASRGGVLTPASGLGAVLYERLRKAGMTLETDKS